MAILCRKIGQCDQSSECLRQKSRNLLSLPIYSSDNRSRLREVHRAERHDRRHLQTLGNLIQHPGIEVNLHKFFTYTTFPRLK